MVRSARAILTRPMEVGDNSPDSDARLSELILYVAAKCADEPRFGATKLNKILWYSDALTYAHHGAAMTGSQYVAREWGPTPRRLIPVRQGLEQAGALEVIAVQTIKGIQHRAIPLRPSKPGTFSERDLKIVDAVILALHDDDAESVSSRSHGIAWQSTPQGDPIPYQMAFISDGPPTESEKEFARKVAREQGFDAA